MSGKASAASLLAALVACACGGGDGDRADATDRSGPATGDGPQGTLTLGEAVYTFNVLTCDSEGRDPDGTTLRGSGTAPDGRPIRIEVERLPPAGDEGRLEHNVFVLFGSISDGEAWSAKRVRTPSGEWREGELGDAAAPGPLVEVSDDRVTARGTLRRKGSDQRMEADLRATCVS